MGKMGELGRGWEADIKTPSKNNANSKPTKEVESEMVVLMIL